MLAVLHGSMCRLAPFFCLKERVVDMKRLYIHLTGLRTKHYSLCQFLLFSVFLCNVAVFAYLFVFYFRFCFLIERSTEIKRLHIDLSGSNKTRVKFIDYSGVGVREQREIL